MTTSAEVKRDHALGQEDAELENLKQRAENLMQEIETLMKRQDAIINQNRPSKATIFFYIILLFGVPILTGLTIYLITTRILYALLTIVFISLAMVKISSVQRDL